MQPLIWVPVQGATDLLTDLITLSRIRMLNLQVRNDHPLKPVSAFLLRLQVKLIPCSLNSCTDLFIHPHL